MCTVYISTQVITHKSLKESYKTIPRSEILFKHDNGRNRDFHCTLELTADNTTTTKLSAVASIKDVSFTYVYLKPFSEHFLYCELQSTVICMKLSTQTINPFKYVFTLE